MSGTTGAQTLETGWTRSRPVADGYGIPETDDGMLALDDVRERLRSAQNYWVGSATPDGRPHGIPVWGAFIDDALYFGTGPRTKRNLSRNPQVSVHLESASEVVVLEGVVAVVESPDPALSTAIDDALGAKYDWRPSSEGDEAVGAGWFCLKPERIIAWTRFPADATRWKRER